MGNITAQLDWSGADAVPVRSVNTVMIQGLGEEVILSFGHAVPPIALAVMNNDQMEKYLKDHPVEVQQIARFALPVHVASTLMQNLQGTLAVHRVIATTAEQEGEATS